MAARIPKTVTLDENLLRRIESSKGNRSTSERINQLLIAGLEAERMQRIDSQIAEFFAAPKDDRRETEAFQRASIRAAFRD